MQGPSQSLRQVLSSRSRWEQVLDQSFVILTGVFALGVVAILLGIGLEVGIQAKPAIQTYGLPFLWQRVWDPVKNIYGILPMIYGTLMSSFLGLLLAIPLGLGTAIALSERLLPAWLQLPLTLGVELLAAVPSVVYGLWGIFVLIPILKNVGQLLHQSFGELFLFSTAPIGPGLLPAGVILAIMILPIITSIARQALVSLPPDLRAISMGLGATRWQTIFKTLLPAAFPGILGAVMLALGRAVGETMAVTMVIGNSNQLNLSILAPANTLASLIASQFAEASGLQISALMYCGCVLFLLTLFINILADGLIARIRQSFK